MLRPKVILSPIDFSNCSLGALDVARDLASRYGSEVVLIHAVPVIPDDVSILREADEKALVEDARQRL